MISSSIAFQASAGPFYSLALPAFENGADGLEDPATSSLPEVSDTGSWVEKLSCSHQGTAVADQAGAPRSRNLSEVLEPRTSSKHRATTETGCLACKKKRKRCDGAKPCCMNCAKSHVTCEVILRPITWEVEKRPGEKKSTVQIRSMTPAHTTSNKAAQGFDDFTASQQYHSGSLQNMVNSDPEAAPYVRCLTVSKQLTPEDGRSGVNPSHYSEHEQDCDGCDGRGSTPSKCTEPALYLSAQPLGRARPGVALEPPVVAQLTCTLADLSQIWAVATLLSHTGEVLLDKLEGKIAEFAHPETVEFRFTQLVINDPGKYRIKITLMQMDFSNSFANVCKCIESDSFLIDAAAPGGDIRADEFDVDERCGFR